MIESVPTIPVARVDAPNFRTRIVTDEELQKALDWLRDSAREMGDAKGETVKASHMLKVTKALEMAKYNELSAAKAEVQALCSENFEKALCWDAEATARYETMRALREAAALKIETWRSEQANYRAMKI